jgi:hypothetical protein
MAKFSKHGAKTVGQPALTSSKPPHAPLLFGGIMLATSVVMIAVVSLAAPGDAPHQVPSRPAADRGEAAIASPDVNNDGTVNMFDMSIVSANFGRTANTATNPRADINGDGVVDVFDAEVILRQNGT